MSLHTGSSQSVLLYARLMNEQALIGRKEEALGLVSRSALVVFQVQGRIGLPVRRD
jgi:hypothetical protein